MPAKNLPDAIRLVPTAAHVSRPAAGGLSYRGGPLIKNVAVHAIYWGSYWATASSPSTANIDQFLTYIVQSPFITQLTEYNVPAYPIGPGTFAESLILNIAVGASLTDAEIQAKVKSLASAAKGKKPSAGKKRKKPAVSINDLYMVFTPPNVQVVMSGTMSCSSFCGYHDDVSGVHYYGVIPYPNCVGCNNANSVFDSLTMITSHELAEAITDPVPGAGWYDDQFGEIGDFCNAEPKTVGSYTVQKIWSASANRCA